MKPRPASMSETTELDNLPPARSRASEADDADADADIDAHASSVAARHVPMPQQAGEASVNMAPPGSVPIAELVASSEAAHPTEAPIQTQASLSLLDVDTVLAVSIFAIVGVLIRIGTNHLTPYDSQLLFGSFYAQVVGCIIMGCVFTLQSVFSPWLYVGLTTGLCGTITTFSSWNQQASTVLVGWHGMPPPSYNSGAFQFVSWMTILVIGLAVSLVSLAFGVHVGQAMLVLLERRRRHQQGNEPARSTTNKSQRDGDATAQTNRLTRQTIILAVVLCVSLVLVIVLPYELDCRDIMFSCILAVPGALSRMWLSLWLNPKRPTFPLGTFTANIIGCVLLGIFTVVQSSQHCFVNNSMCVHACEAILERSVSTWLADFGLLILPTFSFSLSSPE
ncbi:hypothetical protein, variant [Capsaspora owczarzaki ATCC 30864]|uniref:Uncharacterized protein n=1 Tax=Capsaspora owczarzaki (strain ATCC 30864) TaxID=595528 RepID=A0A0D2WV21_CAPO3|nr:hypothetical protein, variant [Capsaspora owczarzaki ATCC 30864]